MRVISLRSSIRTYNYTDAAYYGRHLYLKESGVKTPLHSLVYLSIYQPYATLISLVAGAVCSFLGSITFSIPSVYFA